MLINTYGSKWYRLRTHDKIKAHARRIMAGETVPEIEHRITRKDGKVRWVSNVPVSHFDSHGRITGYDGLIRDITERKNTEAVLQNAEKLESLGLLAGGIAHDFNNLLAGILGYVDMARKHIRNSDPVGAEDYLSRTAGSFDMGKGLTRQLLTFAKGGIPVRRVQVVTDLVRKSVQFALGGSNVIPYFDIPSDIWLCDIDENQIAQAIDNITLNARQAMPQRRHV